MDRKGYEEEGKLPPAKAWRAAGASHHHHHHHHHRRHRGDACEAKAKECVLPRRVGYQIRRMKTTIVVGGNAASYAVGFRRDDGSRTTPPNHPAAVSRHNNQITVASGKGG